MIYMGLERCTSICVLDISLEISGLKTALASGHVVLFKFMIYYIGSPPSYIGRSLHQVNLQRTMATSVFI